jgi:hypothetical protein
MNQMETERVHLASMMWKSYLPQVLHALVSLGIPDLLGSGPASLDRIAHRSETHAPSLFRLLRAAITAGVVTVDGDLFGLTARGELLRADVPGSMRETLLWHGSKEKSLSWGELAYSVRTGQDAFRHIFGRGMFEHLAEHPDKEAIFNETMAARSRIVAKMLSDIPDIARSARVADVGGGSGAILAGVLAENRGMRGLLFDTESGLRDAEATVSAAGVRERCEIVAGDFFTSVPGGCDAYLLKHVIHDWNDDEAVTILRHCRYAMPRHATLYIVESVVPEDPAEYDAVTMIWDLNMLVSLSGRERTRSEFARLLASADLTLTSVSTLPPPGHMYSLLGASPA